MAAIPLSGEPVPPFDPANPPEGRFSDEWFIVNMQGRPSGWMHNTIDRDGTHITSKTEMELRVRRADARLTIQVDMTNRELLDGTPVGFDQTMNLGGVPIETRGKIRDGRVRIRESQMGRTTEREFPWDAEARLSWGILREQVRRGFAAGTRYTIKTYDASIAADRAIPADTEVIGPETIELGGSKVRAIRVQQTLLLGAAASAPAANGVAAALGNSIRSDSWIDESGNALRIDSKLGGLFDLSMVRSTRLTAMADAEPPELFLSTLITARGKVPMHARRVVYRLSVTGDAQLPELPATAAQRFERIDAQTGRLTVRSDPWIAGCTAQVAPLPPEAAAQVEATLYADSRDARIMKLAREADLRGGNPGERADSLRKFVSTYVRHKNLGVGFATATEVAESREGDCTEHAVLLAALARACGIPSRAISGIVGVPGEAGPAARFGYHMWTEVYVCGRWRYIDAALAQTECDPTHIALAMLDLSQGSVNEASLSFLPILGALTIEIESAE